ncbi:MAG: DNA-processing protein DprA [Lachnospiraceae bacterium]|nr:DNA-processing protein DprA [Lachnospiraceae bacterium]
MDDRIYDYWVATLQDGYIGNITGFTEKAGGAGELYRMSADDMEERLGLSPRLAGYIDEKKTDIGILEEEYFRLDEKGIFYMDHKDDDFPRRLLDIPSPPYGLFVKGSLPSDDEPVVAVVGARECSEYGRLMADYLGNRLAKEGVAIVSGMAWGIDGLTQDAALSAGGRSYAVLGCGVDVIYQLKNRGLYNRLIDNGNGVISEYAPGTRAEPRRFPPRNRIISGLCDVLIVVEARAKSGTLITVDMAIDQGKEVMVVPGRLTDDLSAGCLKLMYQGAHPVTGIDSVLEQLRSDDRSQMVRTDRNKEKKKIIMPIASKNEKSVALPEELKKVLMVLTLDPQSTEQIADMGDLSVETTLVMLTKLEMLGFAREVWPGYFIKKVAVS